MSRTRWIGPLIPEDTAQAVIKAYTGAAAGRAGARNNAFDAALRTYQRRHPDVSEADARQRAAQILCFAGTKSAV